MTFLAWLRKRIAWPWHAHNTQEHQQLLVFLREAYIDESKNVLNFTQHAERMYYPHLRERLLRLVEEERSHVQWLKEKIRLLGGEVPQVPFYATRGANTWENLRRDLEQERKDDSALVKGLHVAERLDRGIAEGLSRLRADEQKHREQLRDLLQKSEPDAVPTPPSSSPEKEQQKQMWLAQQKITWLEQRRAQWEAEGKPISWAEWVARREYEWTANELPNRELHWARQLTMPTATDNLVPRVSGKL